MIDRMLTLFPVLAERRRTQAENLSGGERQQLAFARALMSGPAWCCWMSRRRPCPRR